MRDYYECRARVACDAHSDCAVPAPGHLGDELSAASERLCRSTDSTFQLQLNAGQGALRDDVIRAFAAASISRLVTISTDARVRGAKRS
jgi:hypothetical protein